MFCGSLCENNKLHGNTACGRRMKANSHHSYNIIIQRDVFVNIKEYRYMTKIGGEIGGNAVILMKIKNGVFFGKTVRKSRGWRTEMQQPFLFTKDRRRIKTINIL